MLRKISCTIIFLLLLILSACNTDSQVESFIKPIRNVFEKVDISLKENAEKSKSFTFSGADEKHFTFDDGNIYLLYNFSNREKTIEQLTKLFAETEFPYGVSRVDTENFIIIFIAKSENVRTQEKIDFVFQQLKSEDNDLLNNE